MKYDLKTDRMAWAIPAKMKREKEPHVYEGTLQKDSDLFEFQYQNGLTTSNLINPSVEQKDGKTYMKFKGYYGQSFIVFFESHDWHLAISDKY